MALYEFDFNNPAGEKIVPVSAGAPGHETSEPGVAGVARVSEDGTHVYFVAGATLTGANAEGIKPVKGADNLYLFERDAAYPQGRTTFLATLSPSDSQDWGAQNQGHVQATPDGRFLVFSSSADLTPDDTSTVGQLFEYDAVGETLVRISVGQKAPGGFECPVTKTLQEGYNCDGNVESDYYQPGLPQPSGLPGWTGVGLAVSDDGSDVFFESPDGLTPGALDDRQINEVEEQPIYAENVYEYHSAVAEGGSIADGNVTLISDGRDLTALKTYTSGTTLFGTDASGADVFFTSGVPLVGQDTDTQVDVYDARVDGGFPQPVSPPGCAGEGCLGSPTVPPLFRSPVSSSTLGGGNLVPPAEGKPGVKSPPKPKPLTRAQKLARALRACAKERKSKRAACRALAEKTYGAKSKAEKKRSSGKGVG